MIIALIATIPEIADKITPTAIGPIKDASAPPAKASGASRMTEPRIDGMEMRNANLTASLRSNPDMRDPKSVEPDLDTPGQIAMPCMQPIKM